MRTVIVLHYLFLMMVEAQQQKRGMAGTFGPRQQKPNIVLVLTDDQDVELGSLNYMPKTLKAIKYQGAEFRHAYVTTPMCCPSRSSLLTGMYVHNHNVYTNNDNCSSTTWQTTHETRSFATYLSNAGYRTGFFGKYLNKYNGSYIPPGWREWGGLIMNSKYYNYSINMNGKKIKHGFDYSKDYYPDLIANDSIAFLRQSKKNSAHKPVMLTMSFPAPHGPEDSAPQYSDLFFNVTSHHIPSYDYAPNPDKQWILQVTNKMQPIHRQFTDLLMTKRLQTLQSVDAAVQKVVEELAVLGELHNTYIIYTSDHGYHLGQFGLIKGKSFPFEFDVRVPFLVRGPGIDPGAIIDEIVLNIDLAPTFLDIAGVDAPPHMDGRSILPLFLNGNRKRRKWPDTFLIESSGRRENPFLEAKLKSLEAKLKRMNNPDLFLTSTTVTSFDNGTSMMFDNDTSSSRAAESTPTPANKIYESEEGLDDDDSGDEKDIHDLLVDPQKIGGLETELQEEEITNQDSPPLKREQMQLDNRVLPGFIPLYTKSERLVKECGQSNMQKPCTFNQKWFCEYDNGRWRKHKCKSIVLNSQPSADKYRKCACFTPHGPVYKKVPVETILRKGFRNMKRNKRDAALNHIITKMMNFEYEMDPSVKSVRKRDTLEQVDDVMLDLKGQIADLQFVNTSIIDDELRSRNLETNRIGDTISGCRILGSGNVNCSNQVYNNRKVWQKSRHEVNNEIQELKDKLDKLKEIRRHLKHYRPYGGDLGTVDSSEKMNRFSELSIGAQHPRINKRKHKKGFETRRTHKPTKARSFVETRTEFENTQNGTAGLGNSYEITTEGIRNHKHKHQKNHPSSTTEKKTSSEIPYPLENCHCETLETDFANKSDEREIVKLNKRRLDEEKMRRKARRQRKKENMDKQCSSEKMNCFHHDNDHWKTVPLWTNGPFCFCMNSNNNTYSCLRTINVTHNFLYCEFTTGLMTFYNLRIDPFELQNRLDQLKPEEKSFLHDQLKEMIACKGTSCTANQPPIKFRGNNLHKPIVNGYHRYKKKRIFTGDSRNGHLIPNGTYNSKHFLRVGTRNNSANMGRKQVPFGTTRRKRKLTRERF